MIKKLLIIASFPLCLSAFADLPAERGYFWGEPYKVDNEKESEDKTDEEKYNLPPLPPYERLVEMHPEELRKMEKEYLDQAVWKRDEESVTEYYTLVKAFRAKSRGFAAAHAYITMSNPELSTNDVIPITKTGVNARKAMAQNDVKSTLAQNKDKYGLIVFYQNSCGTCKAMYPIYTAFKNRHNWDVAYIDAVQNPELARDFNITATPMVALVKANTNKKLIVSNGAVSLPTLEEDIYRSTRYLDGKITLQQFLTSDYQIGTSLDPNKGL